MKKERAKKSGRKVIKPTPTEKVSRRKVGPRPRSRVKIATDYGVLASGYGRLMKLQQGAQGIPPSTLSRTKS